MAKKESKLKQAARGATAPFKNVGRDTRRMLRPVPPPPAVALYPNDLGVLTGPTASTTVPMTALERLKAAAQGASAPFKNMGRDMRGEAAPVAPMPGISPEELQALAAALPPTQAGPGQQANAPQIPMPSMTDVPPVNMADFETIRSMNMDPRTNTGLAGSFNSMDDSLARAASAIDAVAARQQARMYDGVQPADMGDFNLIRNMGTAPVTLNPPTVPMPSVDPTMPAALMGIPDSRMQRLPYVPQPPQPGDIQRGPYVAPDSTDGLMQRLDAVAVPDNGQVDPATIEHWRNLYGPDSRRQPLDAGSGAYNQGGRIGPISEAEMAAIMAGPGPGFREQANNPDPRDLSRIPLAPERVPASVQALPPDELAALQDRLHLGGDIRLSGGPLQKEASYPDLIAAARAKLAGQDVTPPTVIGSDRYRGGSAQAQQMQKESWARTRAAQDARAANQATRMQNDPLTMYRAARAGNPDAALRMQLQALGGANTPAAMGAMFGPGAAIGAMQMQGQNAAVAADLQKAKMEQETVLRATLAPQILNRAAEYVKAGMDPAAAHNQATQEVTAAATQQQLPLPPPQPEQPGMFGQLWGGIKQAWNGGGVGMLPWLGGK